MYIQTTIFTKLNYSSLCTCTLPLDFFMNFYYPSLCTNVFFFCSKDQPNTLLHLLSFNPLWLLFSLAHSLKYIVHFGLVHFFLGGSPPTPPPPPSPKLWTRFFLFISIVWSTLASVAPSPFHKNSWLQAHEPETQLQSLRHKAKAIN